MELKRAYTNCFVAPSDEQLGVPVSSASVSGSGIELRSGRILLSGEHDLSSSERSPAPGIAVGSGYPVSGTRPGLVGLAALRVIADWLLGSSHYAVLDEFDGPFLVIVFRPRTREIVAVRDKFGLRQAYYHNDGPQLVLGDDMSTLRDHWGGIRPAGLVEWMHYGSALEPLSLFRQVRCLAAGSVLTFSTESGECRIERYFSPEQCVSSERYAELGGLRVPELKQHASEQLDHAIAHALSGQKEVSILLSGGVDSSLLTAFARRHAHVNAVTVDIQGPGGETEIRYAADVARILRVDFLSLPFGPRQFVETFCDNIQALATPLIIENAVALHYAAASGALPRGQLILDGEGADALTAGSTPLFKYSMLLFLLRQIPVLGRLPFRAILERLRRILDRLGVATRTTLDNGGLDTALGIRGAELALRQAMLEKVLAHVTPREAHEIACIMLREFYDYLVPIMLRLDRMCLAANTHAVLPFFFSNVFGLLQNLPMQHKIRWDWARLRPVSKFLTKEMLAEHISHQLVHRPKVGFGIPAWLWIRMPSAWQEDSWVAEHFGLSRQALESWVQRNQGERDLLYLASMEVWGRLFDRRMPFAEVKGEWLAAQESVSPVLPRVWADRGEVFAPTVPAPPAGEEYLNSTAPAEALEPVAPLSAAAFQDEPARSSDTH